MRLNRSVSGQCQLVKSADAVWGLQDPGSSKKTLELFNRLLICTRTALVFVFVPAIFVRLTIDPCMVKL